MDFTDYLRHRRANAIRILLQMRRRRGAIRLTLQQEAMSWPPEKIAELGAMVAQSNARIETVRCTLDEINEIWRAYTAGVYAHA